MSDLEKKIDALIDALGFDIETIKTKTYGCSRKLTYNEQSFGNPRVELEFQGEGLYKEVTRHTDYKATNRDSGVKQFAADVFYRTGDIVPLPIKSKAWGCIVEYVTSHADDIESSTNDFGTLKPVWEFMNMNSHD